MKLFSTRLPFNTVIFSLGGQFLLMLLFNSVIALLITVLKGQLGDWRAFGITWVYAQSIGMSIFLLVTLLGCRHQQGPRLHEVIFGIVLGSIIGSLLGGFLVGAKAEVSATDELGANIMLGIVFGTAIGYFFFSSYRLAQNRLVLREKENQQLAAEKQLTETRLRLLQAQIEPHFLFNTLANIHSLIETDPSKASSVLESFSDYLRVSLRRSREANTTLGDELALIRAYLEIQQARMGKRLQAHIEVSEDLYALPCPPMLIQPLVENAVVHGLEPRVSGGRVSLQARRDDDRLCIEVRDDGVGIQTDRSNNGVALENIRERLQALYGATARLELQQLATGGVQVQLELPVTEENSD